MVWRCRGSGLDVPRLCLCFRSVALPVRHDQTYREKRLFGETFNLSLKNEQQDSLLSELQQVLGEKTRTDPVPLTVGFFFA